MPFITGVITHLLSGMSHQVGSSSSNRNPGGESLMAAMAGIGRLRGGHFEGGDTVEASAGWPLKPTKPHHVRMVVGATYLLATKYSRTSHLLKNAQISSPWCWYIKTYKTGWFCSGKCWDSYSSTMVRIWDGRDGEFSPKSFLQRLKMVWSFARYLRFTMVIKRSPLVLAQDDVRPSFRYQMISVSTYHQPSLIK